LITFAHRINTAAVLKGTPSEYGVELDLRSDGEQIYIHHEAFEKGEKFEDWLQEYHHAGLILNTKCEGMEEQLLGLMQKHAISNYFFLDLSLPFLVKYLNRGVRNIAVRYSEYEPLEFVKKFSGKVDWVWVDCFDGQPVSPDILKELASHFRTCIVSPELQGYEVERIAEFRAAWAQQPIDAVCTKRPDLWK
jgi:hypothetical protein